MPSGQTECLVQPWESMTDPAATSRSEQIADWLDEDEIASRAGLPIGKLFPREVRLSPRDRLLIAMAEAVREHGFRGASIADVVRRAKTSRRTFYEQFSDREDCFLALFDLSNAIFAARVAAVLDPAKPWRDQISDAVDVYLAVVRAEPQITIAFAREVGGLGERGAARQRQEVENFARWLIGLVDIVAEHAPEVRPLDFDTAMIITGGLRESITFSLEEGRDLERLAVAIKSMIVRAVSPGADPPEALR